MRWFQKPSGKKTKSLLRLMSHHSSKATTRETSNGLNTIRSQELQSTSQSNVLGGKPKEQR